MSQTSAKGHEGTAWSQCSVGGRSGTRGLASGLRVSGSLGGALAGAEGAQAPAFLLAPSLEAFAVPHAPTMMCCHRPRVTGPRGHGLHLRAVSQPKPFPVRRRLPRYLLRWQNTGH